MEIRRFNEGDWRGFGGAEKFSNGEEPWILENVLAADDFPSGWWGCFPNPEERLLTVVVDKNGVEISGTDGGMVWYPSPFPSRDPEEMEIRDQVGGLILYLFYLLKEVSYQKFLNIGFKEY